MQTQYINEMLDIPELQILEILPMSAEEVHIKVTPVAQKQCCPTCRSDEFVILKGNNGGRKVRHLPGFEKKVYLLLSAIRMYGSKCEAGFVWDYLCVGPKKRYSNLFRERAAAKRLVLRQRIAPACSKRQPPRSNKCITILCLKNANDLQSKLENKPKKVAAWS